MATTAVAVKEKRGVATKTTTSEDLLNRMSNAFDAISRRAFEIFEGNGRVEGHAVEDWFKAEKELFHPLHFEITELDNSISVKAEVPGFTEKELQVTVELNRLTISGKRESSKEEEKGKTSTPRLAPMRCSASSIYSSTLTQERLRQRSKTAGCS